MCRRTADTTSVILFRVKYDYTPIHSVQDTTMHRYGLRRRRGIVYIRLSVAPRERREAIDCDRQVQRDRSNSGSLRRRLLRQYDAKPRAGDVARHESWCPRQPHTDGPSSKLTATNVNMRWHLNWRVDLCDHKLLIVIKSPVISALAGFVFNRSPNRIRR